jgi:hypothetical protein
VLHAGAQDARRHKTAKEEAEKLDESDIYTRLASG